MANPDARLSILFLPFFSFSASKVFHAFKCFKQRFQNKMAAMQIYEPRRSVTSLMINNTIFFNKNRMKKIVKKKFEK